MQKQKKIYLEVLRIIAMFFVVFVHTGTDGAEHYQVASSGIIYILWLAASVVAQICVPIFFLISGAVLLQKQESFKTVYLHRVLPTFLVILIFGFVQYCYFYFLNPEIGFSISVYFKMVYSTNVITQYWYIYTYLGFLMVLPFIRMLANDMTEHHFWYLFSLYVMFEGFLPIIEYLWGNTRTVFNVPLMTTCIVYPLTGYYLEHVSKELFYKKKNLLFSFVVGVCALTTNCVVAMMAHRQRGNAEFLSGMTAILAVVLFIFIRALFHKLTAPVWLQKTFLFLGGGTFGVYLLEPQLRDTFKIIYTKTIPYLPNSISCFLWVSCAVLCGVLIMNILRKIPVIQKLF